MHRQAETQILWIDAAEAAICLNMKLATLISKIEKGTFKGKVNERIPFDSEGKPNYLVPLASMPQKAQYRYYTSHLDPEKIYSADLVTPTERFGDAWLKDLSMSCFWQRRPSESAVTIAAQERLQKR